MSYDLRMAIESLRGRGELAALESPVDPRTEITGIYRYFGAGGTVMRPTRVGPALLCTNIKGFPNTRVLIGMESRGRLSKLLGCPPEELSRLLLKALDSPVEPRIIDGAGDDVCYENFIPAGSEGFDIRRILPAPCTTPEDAGPYITMGMCCARDPETGDMDVTIHRICLQSEDEMTISFAPGRHIDVFRAKAEAMGKPLPISISIGYDPVIAMASCFQPPTTPLGFNELSIAGGLRRRPVDMVRCRTVDCCAIAGSEFVVEGLILPGRRMREDINTLTGKAMPEFTGYPGVAEPALPIIKVTAAAHRTNPIIQCCIGSGNEHTAMVGPPLEASVLRALDRAMPGKVLNVYAHPSGGGKFMMVIQVRKQCERDEGIQRQAALVAFATFKELKHVILVDEDVDPFDTDDVLWALNTRFQGDVDTVMLPGTRMHHVDPSSWPEYSHSVRSRGQACKMIFDCTVPYTQRDRFRRARFAQVNMDDYEFIPL